jgi:hypothetical protein
MDGCGARRSRTATCDRGGSQQGRKKREVHAMATHRIMARSGTTDAGFLNVRRPIRGHRQGGHEWEVKCLARK